jgi:general secretion pathway protein L
VLLLTHFHDATADGSPQWDWVQWRAGDPAARQGQASSAHLPPDDDTVLLVPADRLSWQQVTLPKVPPSRLRATLEGLLEDRLLEDPSQLHFALEPGARPDQGPVTAWVAVCPKAWLQTRVQDLEHHQRSVNRIVPAVCPGPSPSYLAHALGQTHAITAMGPAGVVRVEATTPGPEVRALLASVHGGIPVLSCWAEPAATAWAESVLPDLAWSPLPPLEQARQQADGRWNLAQFEFRPSSGRWRQGALGRTGKAFWQSKAWRPVRWGLTGLLLVQLLGLNALAWQERRLMGQQLTEIRTLLTRTFPHVTLVLDAPVQMQREVDRLRQSHGEVGREGLEVVLQTLASAVPDGPLTLQEIRYRPGEIQLQGLSLTSEQEAKLRARLQDDGWLVQVQGPRWQLSQGARP